jgi:hypothetical protein
MHFSFLKKRTQLLNNFIAPMLSFSFCNDLTYTIDYLIGYMLTRKTYDCKNKRKYDPKLHAAACGIDWEELNSKLL